MVSAKFNKSQLVGALKRWTQEAAELAPPTLQEKLFIELKFIRGSRKHVDLSKAIYIEQDDGSVAALEISSPGPNPNDRVDDIPLSQSAASFLPDISPIPLDGTPFSTATSASSFARRMNGAASFQTLAATETNDPGVPEENAPPPAVPANEGVRYSRVASFAPYPQSRSPGKASNSDRPTHRSCYRRPCSLRDSSPEGPCLNRGLY